MATRHLLEWTFGSCTALILIAPRGSVVWLVLLTVALACASAAHLGVHRGLLKRLKSPVELAWNRPSLQVPVGILFLCYAAGSAGWSIDPTSSAAKPVSLAILVSLAMVSCALARDMSLEVRHQICRGAINGGIIGCLYLATELATDGVLRQALVNHLVLISPNPTFDIVDGDLIETTDRTFFNRHIGALAILFWPLALLNASRLKWKAGLVSTLVAAVATAAIILAGNSETAKVLIAVSGLTWVVAVYAQRLIAICLTAGAITMLLFSFEIVGALLPLTWRPVGQLPPTAVDRIYIWHHTIEHGRNKPWLGYGADATPYLNKLDKKENRDAGFHDFRFNKHAHNWAIQIRFELGIIGAAILAIFVWLVSIRLWCPSRHSPYLLAFASVICFKFISASSFWNYWIWSVILIAVVLLQLRPNEPPVVSSPDRADPPKTLP